MTSATRMRDSQVDLLRHVLDLEKERFSMRIQKSTGSTVKNSRFSEIRKEIARIKFVMGQIRA